MRKYNKLVFFPMVLLLLFTVSGLKAQAPTDKVLIKGRVIDGSDKQPVIGATVIEQNADKRTVTGVSTNIEGNFAIRVSNVRNSLVISIVGYKAVTLPIGARREFNVTLQPSTADLAEVAIVGQKTQGNGVGMNIDTRDLTTSVVTINSKEVEELQAASIDQALQGRLPGVDIVSRGGDPGAGMSIQIRGTNSLNGATNPLVVVDGVPYSTTIPSDFNFANADNQQYANLLSIAPTDIQDISVLKDAAATAVWGSRAANGVLVINTKRGRKGSPSITYTLKPTLQFQSKPLPLLSGDQYSNYIPEMVMNVLGFPINTTTVRELAYDPLDKFYYNNYSQNTDWLKEITRPGLTVENNLSISGGGDKARYFASVGYTNQKGTTVGTAYNRINTRLNLDYIISDKLQFTTFISYSHGLTKSNYANVRSTSMTRMPNMSIYEFDDQGRITSNYFSPAANIQGQYATSGTGATIFNPAAMANYATNNSISDRVTPHFTLQYRVSDALKATGDIVFDINNTKQERFLPQNATGRPFTESTVNRAQNSDSDAFGVDSKINLIYSPKLGEKHWFQGLISLQSSDSRNYTQGQLTSNSASSALVDPSAPARTTTGDAITASTSQGRTVAVASSAQYKLLDRYIFNGGLRLDGSSKFGKSSRYGLFPSLSVAYRFSGEPFMKKYDKWLDDLRFRFSWAHSGNEPNENYLHFQTYASTATSYLGESGIYPTNIQLNKLQWEDQVGINTGFNLVMFKNRVDIAFDVYRNRTNKLISDDIAIPSTNGYASVTLNTGRLQNKGVELNIMTSPYRSRNLNIDFNFNIANNINTLLEISPYSVTQNGNMTQNNNYFSLLQVNNPLGSIYGYKFKGVYKDAAATIAVDADGKQIVSPAGLPVLMRFNYPATDYVFQPGDAIYEDINHDGNINFQDVVYLGNGNPKFTGGFGPTFTFKRKLSLNAFFNYRLGGDIINQTKMNTTNQYNYSNQSTAVLRRWRTSGNVTDMPRALYQTGFNWLGSDRYVEKSTFLRLRSVTLRYTLDKAIASRIKAKNISAYLVAEQLLTFTRYTGQDPEVSVNGGGLFQKVSDNSTTPPLKQFTFGLTASF